MLEQIPHGRYLSLVLEPGEASAFTAGVTSEVAVEFGKSIVHWFGIDWSAAGFGGHKLDGLVEFTLLAPQSFIVDPGGPARQDAGLRTFRWAWIAPAVTAQARASAPPAK